MCTAFPWLLALLVPVRAQPAAGTDWPNFRGPHNAAVSQDKGLPIKWSDQDNVVWKTALPGPGSSSPIVWGNRVFVTCYTGYGLPGGNAGEQKNLKRHLLCLDRKKGMILWDRAVDAKLPETRYSGYIELHGYASSTPATDGKQVYVFFGKSGVLAYDFEGKRAWQANVGSGTDGWGSATSPVLYKDLVIVNASVESGALVALRKKDGKEAWKLPGISRAWNSPVLVDVPDGRQEIAVRVPTSLVGVDPATGKKLWYFSGFHDGYVTPTVVAHDGVVYSLGGRFEGMAVAVKAGGKGDVTNTHKVWTKHLGGFGPIPSPAFYNGYIYWVGDVGAANCVQAKNGEKVYNQRIPSSGTLYASVVIGDGHIYAVSRKKGTFVLAAKPKYELLAQNSFAADQSIFNASPAIGGGQLFLRSDKFLYCLGKK
jgi:outer membrane protein assembly factor BamB